MAEGRKKKAVSVFGGGAEGAEEKEKGGFQGRPLHIHGGTAGVAKVSSLPPPCMVGLTAKRMAGSKG